MWMGVLCLVTWCAAYIIAYINEMQVQEAKSPLKNPVRQRCAEGFNSGVKGSILTGRREEGCRIVLPDDARNEDELPSAVRRQE
jgi:hypothetical protein